MGRELPELLSATQALINIFTLSESKQDFLDNVVDLIRQESRCNFVGIRVLDKEGNIPYESYIGFSCEFWKAENMLSILKHECVCTRVVKGQTLPCDMPVINKTGSFCCNDIESFIGKLSQGETKFYRRVCTRFGFRSVTVIPIRYRGTILGAVHMADLNPDKFTSSTIEFIESVTPLIGEVLHRDILEQTIKKSQADFLIESIRRKEAEYILKQNQQDFQSILENISDVVSRFDKNHRFRYINSAIARVTGFPPEYYIGKLCGEIEPQKDIQQVCDEYIGKVFETGQGMVLEFEYDYGSGTRYFQARFSPEFDDNHNVKSVLKVNRDITDSVLLKTQREALLEAENRLFTSGPVIAYKRQPGVGGRIEYISPNVNQFGYEQQDFLSGKLNYITLIHPHDVRRWKAAEWLQEKRKCYYSDAEFRIRIAGGEYRWIYAYKILLTDEHSGLVSGIQGYILDITKRKNSEDALRESEKKYHELVEAVNVIIMHLDEKGQILFVNKYGQKFFGFPVMELLNHSVKKTILPQYESTGRNLWDVFEDMFSNPAKHQHCILENVQKDGRRVWIQWTNRFSKNLFTGRPQLITVGVDITMRRRAEASLKINYKRYRRNKLIGDLLENRISEDDFFRMAKTEDVSIQTPVACCLVNFDFSDSRLKYLTDDRDELQTWMETAVDLISARLGGIVCQGEGEIAVLHHFLNQSSPSFSVWVDNLSGVVKDVFRNANCVIAVSSVHNEIKIAYQQARETAIVGPIFNPEKHIFYWNNLGMGKLILEHAKSSVGNGFIKEWLGPLVEMPSLKNEELLCTLKELISGDPMNIIADRLHVHPKTLLFRKRKIEQILGNKLDDSEARLNIAVALKLRQLQEKLSI